MISAIYTLFILILTDYNLVIISNNKLWYMAFIPSNDAKFMLTVIKFL